MQPRAKRRRRTAATSNIIHAHDFALPEAQLTMLDEAEDRPQTNSDEDDFGIPAPSPRKKKPALGWRRQTCRDGRGDLPF
jgi:hypothetical protein